METHVSKFHRTLKQKTRTELVQEIAILELEVIQLEKRLLSLYEKAFDRRISTSADLKETNSQVIVAPTSDQGSQAGYNCARVSQDHQQVITDIVPLEYTEPEAQQDQGQETVLGSSLHHRCHSSLDHHSAFAIAQSSPLVGKVADAVFSYQSLPLTLLQHGAGEASDYMNDYSFCKNRLTANLLSEELIRCISTIYCKLAANSMIRNGLSSPAVSSISLMSCSPASDFDPWTPQSKVNPSQDLHSDVSLHGRYQEFSGLYSDVVEVLHLCRDSGKMKDVQPMLQEFRSLVTKLEEISPSKLKHEEKLAFWINVHNALVMHAYLVYGIPQVKLKRASLLLKAAYNIGGHTVSISMMQDYILGTRLPHLGQWFHRFIHRYNKFRSRDDSKSFATDRPEPLSYFALCCGSFSDPPVRVYTPSRVYQELILARGDYISSNYRVNKDQNKVFLPKIMDTYVKESGLHPADFRSIVEQILPVNDQRNTNSGHQWRKKGLKCIGWIPHDFAFRYQFHKEVLQ